MLSRSFGVYFTIMVPTPSPIDCRAYAKINIGLRVTEKRADGYHEITTVFHRIELFDDITLSPARDVTVVSTDPEVPSGESNICHAAAAMLRQHLGTGAGVRIDVTKRIPAGAGLGGGSADAAAVLRRLPALWGESVSAHDLRAMALRLGSDVPFFLGDESAVGIGRGETLEYFRLDVPFAILLCTPPVRVSTAWAYAHIVPRPGPVEDLRSILLRGMADPSILRNHIANDFESPVFQEYPVIRSIRDLMVDDGALFVSMSGSGSTVYGFFPDAGRAAAAARPLDSLNFRTFITPPHFRA